MKVIPHIEIVQYSEAEEDLIQKPYLITGWAHDEEFAFWIAENPEKTGPVSFVASLWVA